MTTAIRITLIHWWVHMVTHNFQIINGPNFVNAQGCRSKSRPRTTYPDHQTASRIACWVGVLQEPYGILASPWRVTHSRIRQIMTHLTTSVVQSMSWFANCIRFFRVVELPCNFRVAMEFLGPIPFNSRRTIHCGTRLFLREIYHFHG